MANYAYQVVDAAGKKSEGVIEAASTSEASKKNSRQTENM